MEQHVSEPVVSEPVVSERPDRRAERLTVWGGRLLVAAALAHLAFFSATTWPDWGHWAAGALWGDRPSTLTEYRLFLEFWALPGSFAAVLLLLGLVIIRLARQGIALPRYVGWGLLAWSAICAALLEPSGFPVGIVASALLIAAHRKQP